jgi:2-C-methyl-D-erythritol 4-phosphate cytidylyltransferase
MGGPQPKQYLQLNGRTVIEHTIDKLLAQPQLAGIYVALSADDGWWESTSVADDPRITRVEGGAERANSVLNALTRLRKSADESDWVLVHDAVRPCLRQDDLDALMTGLADHPVGGLLGVAVQDSMKRTDNQGRVEQTVPREQLWHAYTPQMFRLGMLHQALSEALAAGLAVTDDASAMEAAGHVPVIIEGHRDNIKITRPEDLALAAFYLIRGPLSNL